MYLNHQDPEGRCTSELEIKNFSQGSDVSFSYTPSWSFLVNSEKFHVSHPTFFSILHNITWGWNLFLWVFFVIAVVIFLLEAQNPKCHFEPEWGKLPSNQVVLMPPPFTPQSFGKQLKYASITHNSDQDWSPCWTAVSGHSKWNQ